jgi:hypothetical protein
MVSSPEYDGQRLRAAEPRVAARPLLDTARDVAATDHFALRRSLGLSGASPARLSSPKSHQVWPACRLPYRLYQRPEQVLDTDHPDGVVLGVNHQRKGLGKCGSQPV